MNYRHLFFFITGGVWTAHIQSHRGWRCHQCVFHQPWIRGHNPTAVTLLPNIYCLHCNLIFFQNCKYWWFINNPLNYVKFQYAFPCSCEYEFRMVAVQEKKLLALWHWLYRGISNPHVLFKTATLSRWGKIDPLGFPLEDFLQQMLIHP